MDKVKEDKLVIILGCLVLFCIQILGNMVTLAIPSISQDFHMNVDLTNAVSLIYLVLVISLVLPLAKIISKYGVGKFLKIGISLGIISLIVCAISPNSTIFLIGRAFQGISSALICCSINLILYLQLSGEDFGKSIGIVLSAGYVGLALSYLFAGIITYYLSWRILFLSLMLLYIVSLFILMKLDKEWFLKKDISIDYRDSIIYSILMILFVGFMSNLDFGGIYILPVCLVLLIIFIWLEKNIEYPLYNIKLLKNPDYMVGNFSSFVVFFTTFIVMYVLNFYLQYALDYNSYMTGLFLLPAAIVMIIFAYIAGKLTVKYDLRLLSVVGCIILIIAGYIIFKMDFIPIYQIFIGCIVLGIGEGFFLASNNKQVGQTIDSENFIDSASFLFTNRELGKTISLSIYFVVAGLMLGSDSSFDDVVLKLIMTGETMMEISIVLLITAIILLFVMWLRKKYIKA